MGLVSERFLFYILSMALQQVSPVLVAALREALHNLKAAAATTDSKWDDLFVDTLFRVFGIED